jgi:hypothetical protein
MGKNSDALAVTDALMDWGPNFSYKLQSPTNLCLRYLLLVYNPVPDENSLNSKETLDACSQASADSSVTSYVIRQSFQVAQAE